MGNDDYQRDSGDSISTRLTYLLIGGGIGAVIALLFAPKSGQELRGAIADCQVPIADCGAAKWFTIGNWNSAIEIFPMSLLALQMNPNDPMFWVMVVIALSFIIIAVAMVAIAVFVSRAVKSVNRLEQKLDPLVERMTVISEQGRQIAVQGKLIAEQFNAVSGH